MTDKLYDDRDIIELDKAGNHYCRHVAAMTAEGLHDKSAIAAELAWRDLLVDNALDLLRITVERNAELAKCSGVSELKRKLHEACDQLDLLRSEKAAAMTERGEREPIASFMVAGHTIGATHKSIAVDYGGFLFTGQCDAEAAALDGLEDQPVTVEVRVFARGGDDG